MNGVTVMLDQLVAPVPGGIGRYTLNMVRALSERDDCPRPLAGVIPRVDAETAARLRSQIPGLDSLRSLPWPRPLLARAWERGVAIPRWSVTYSPSLFAPLRNAGQHIVTIHDAVPWTHPETLTGHGATWHRTMGERAARFADAIVVPTAAVAERISTYLPVHDRIHVIGGAPAIGLSVPQDAAERRARLSLPPRYLAFVGTLEPRKGLERLLESLATLDGIPIVVIGPTGWGNVRVDDLVTRTGIRPDRVIALGRLNDADMTSVLSTAHALIVPSIDEGFGLPVIEAMSLGIPVIHSTAPALVEVAGGHGIAIDVHGVRGDIALAEAITGLDDEALRRDLASRGRSRAAQFTWAASAAALATLIADITR